MKITLTPAIKGQLTKARNNKALDNHAMILGIRAILQLRLNIPREQAKHAARKYLAAVQG